MKSKPKAKINLTLNIISKREDGYHELESVFQKISLCDKLYLKKSKNDNVEIKCNVKELEKDNIIIKAYELLKSKYKNITGVKVKLIKNIPSEAGLGGGSTDCASFILMMNKMFDLKLSEEELIEISKSLGADVAPLLYDVALKANGIGEKIELIDTDCEYYLLIIKPQFSFSTGEMFKKYDSSNEIKQKINTLNMIEALKHNSIEVLSNNLYNVFEEVVPEKEKINYIKEQLIENGALNALMSGSGSSVYGIFKNKKEALKAYKKLNNRYQIYFCKSINMGENL